MTGVRIANVPSGWTSPVGSFLVFLSTATTVDVAARAHWNDTPEETFRADAAYTRLPLSTSCSSVDGVVYWAAQPAPDAPDLAIFGLASNDGFTVAFPTPRVVRSVHLHLLATAWAAQRPCNGSWGCCCDLGAFVPSGVLLPAALLDTAPVTVVGFKSATLAGAADDDGNDNWK